MPALDYKASAELMTNADFRGRVKVACIKFADFILLEPINTPAHNTRVKWAQMAESQPDGTAAQIQPVVVMDPAVQQDGAAVTDAALQSAVEAAVNKML